MSERGEPSSGDLSDGLAVRECRGDPPDVLLPRHPVPAAEPDPGGAGGAREVEVHVVVALVRVVALILLLLLSALLLLLLLLLRQDVVVVDQALFAGPGGKHNELISPILFPRKLSTTIIPESVVLLAGDVVPDGLGGGGVGVVLEDPLCVLHVHLVVSDGVGGGEPEGVVGGGGKDALEEGGVEVLEANKVGSAHRGGDRGEEVGGEAAHVPIGEEFLFSVGSYLFRGVVDKERQVELL